MVKKNLRFLYKGVREDNKPVFGTLYADDFEHMLKRLADNRIRPVSVMCHEGDQKALRERLFASEKAFRAAEKRLRDKGKLIDLKLASQ